MPVGQLMQMSEVLSLGLWSDQCLGVDGCSSVNSFEGQCHHVESDAGRSRRPVEVMEEGGHMEETFVTRKKSQHITVDKVKRPNRNNFSSSHLSSCLNIIQSENKNSIAFLYFRLLLTVELQ